MTYETKIYSSYPPSGTVSDTLTFTVSVTVASLTDLSLVPVGTPFSLPAASASLSFGTLVPKASRSVDLMVRTNVKYSFSLMSAHGGSLANDADGTLLSYSLTAGGIPLSFTSGIPATVFLNSAATYSTAKRYGISVTIDEFAEFPTEGTYSDLITVTVLAP